MYIILTDDTKDQNRKAYVSHESIHIQLEPYVHNVFDKRCTVTGNFNRPTQTNKKSYVCNVCHRIQTK